MTNIKYIRQVFFSIGSGVIFFIILGSTTITASAAEVSLYVSPDGNDQGTGAIEDPLRTLAEARDRIRIIAPSSTSDTNIFLRGGTYVLNQPLLLTAADSGINGHTIKYQNFPGEQPVVSGGEAVGGWTLDGELWKAYVGTGIEFRQLWVNGQRATRSRSDSSLELGRDYWATPQGFYFAKPNISQWKNPSTIELVGNNAWKQFRCRVANIQLGQLIVQQPCWNNAQRDDTAMNTVEYLENAFELLDQPGEWYLDTTSGWLFYKPFNHQSISTTSIVRPVLETLISGNGVHNILFEGLTFEYATWSRPSSAEGYASVQANTTYVGNGDIVKSPANITFSSSSFVTFKKNIFTRLGGAGINFDTASFNNLISNNHFTDISGNAIQIGDIEVTSPISFANEVSNNYIHHVATEYQDAVGIWFGYAKNATVAHNEVFALPYTAISLGWGWGNGDQVSEAANNSVSYNYVHHHVQTLADGGGIYTLSSQPNSSLNANLITNQGRPFGAIYLDTGSRFFSVSQNICIDNPESAFVKGGDNVLQNNFWKEHVQVDADPSPDFGPIVIEPNTTISTISDAPTNLVASAGLELAHREIQNLSYPTNLASRCDRYGTSVQLSWNPSNFSTDYSIIFEGDSVVTATSTLITKSIQCGKDYRWWVHNDGNQTNAPGSKFSCPCDTTERPNPPTGLFLTHVAYESIGLMWSASQDHYGISGYKIFRDNQHIGTTSNLFFTDNALLPSTKYSYTISAIDAVGHESVASDLFQVVTANAPTQPEPAPTPPASAPTPPTPQPKVLGLEDAVPDITPLRVEQGRFLLKNSTGTKSIRPAGAAFKGKISGWKVQFKTKKILYLFVPIRSSKNIVVYDSKGHRVDSEQIKPEFIDLLSDLDFQYDSIHKRFFLFFSTIPSGHVQVFELTQNRLKKIQTLSASKTLFNSPTVLSMKLDKKNFIFATILNNKESSLRLWAYHQKKKRFIAYTPTKDERDRALKKIQTYLSTANK